MDLILPPADFLQERENRIALDVRSPGEYIQGHIPGAISFPLFTDDERAEVGTLYKQTGKEAALLLGLKIAGPKLERFVREAATLAPNRKLAVHCWRGGQRSQSMAWLFRQAGFDTVTLNGGYKAYRHLVLDSFSQQGIPLIVVGGQTGTGKTKILHALEEQGEQIIDLEALAHHKGSAFGAIGEQPQPTVEQFENNLHDALFRLDISRRIWVENESRSIGRIFIPDGLWAQMKEAPLYNIAIPFDCRINNLLEDYVGISVSELESAFLRIEKKLGGQHLKTALEALRVGDFATAAEIALRYYDKAYRFGLETNPSPAIRMLNFDHGNPNLIARECIMLADAGRKSVPLEAPGKTT